MKQRIACLTLLALLLMAFPSFAQEGTTKGSLRINEIMASNKASLEDSFGKYPDWIELVNTSNESIDLSTVTLSDKEDKLDKYTFPAGTTLEPGAYIVVFASGLQKDILPDERHAPFKLSASEENVYLSMDGILIDTISFTSQLPDISLALDEQGTPSQTITPTPGWENQIVAPET